LRNDYINNYFAVFTLWVGFDRFSGLLHSSYVIQMLGQACRSDNRIQ
jgi:hypothetical protein